jgi:hypothetical protein
MTQASTEVLHKYEGGSALMRRFYRVFVTPSLLIK